jgi:hypothetical protein
MDRTVDALPKDVLENIDAGVRRTVEWLRAHGFDTTRSSDGMDVEHGPYIEFVVGARWLLQAECERLATLLRTYGVRVVPTGTNDGESTEIRGQYCPVTDEDQAARVVVYELDDARLFGRMSGGMIN